MRSLNAFAVRYVEECGSYRKAIEELTDLSRQLWTSAFDEGRSTALTNDENMVYRVFARRIKDIAQPELKKHVGRLLGHLHSTGLIIYRHPEGHRTIGFHPDTFQPRLFMRALLGNYRPESDLLYFIRRSILDHYQYAHAPETIRRLHLLAELSNRHFAQDKDRRHWTYTDYVDELKSALDNIDPDDAKKTIAFFLELCRDVGFVAASRNELDCIYLRTNTIDPEFLISNAFGVPTSIPGFDDLFGGGGLMLSHEGSSLGGRTVLVKGRYGTGKTLLAFQMATEVVRKGGIAWMMPLEQTAEEYLYTLESMRLMPGNEQVRVASTIHEALDVLSADSDVQGTGSQEASGEEDSQIDTQSGVLIILQSTKVSLDAFLAALKSNAAFLEDALARKNLSPLRLMCVDPINSVESDPKTPLAHQRASFVKALESINKSCTNVMLVAEHDDEAGQEVRFEDKISDTVIALSLERQRDFTQRYLEITKSRHQREQRGMHPFNINSGEGIHVFPSSSSVSNRIRPRRVERPGMTVGFGLPSLDEIIGPRGIYSGDIIVLEGPSGSFKTSLGLIFLINKDLEKTVFEPASLLVTTRDATRIGNTFKTAFLSKYAQRFEKDPPIICSLPGGNIPPGLIFQEMEEHFLAAIQERRMIVRVMIDSLVEWEDSPLIRQDETFSYTLLEFLRRNRVTTLITCRDMARRSIHQQSVINNSDCLLQLKQFEFRGKNRVQLRVVKTRTGGHRPDSFEVATGTKGAELRPNSSLLRIVEGGKVHPIKMRFFLHAESVMQEAYNKTFVDAVSAILAPDTKIDVLDRIYMRRAARLGPLSALDELHILQLDEFQVSSRTPNFENVTPPLYEFSSESWQSNEWDDLFPFLKERVRKPKPDGRFVAVPYFENLGMLAYRKDHPEMSGLIAEACTKWEDLARLCVKWDAKNREPGKLFFDFPRGTPGNYNCLFFEILLSLLKPGERKPRGLKELLLSGKAMEAAKLYYFLCRRAYVESREDVHKERKLTEFELRMMNRAIRVSPHALVWRHWYTTLNQMMSDEAAPEEDDLIVDSLPGDVAVAGEWYLAVPAYSAAPQVGLEMIQLLTTRQAELDRLRAGVGLPTRRSFYETGPEADVPVSPYFSVKLGKLKDLLDSAFRRSSYRSYPEVARILATHLQRVLEIRLAPGTGIEDEGLMRQIQTIFSSLRNCLLFVKAIDENKPGTGDSLESTAE